MRIWLVRHGLTDDVGHRLAGLLPDCHLNADGREQAERLSRRFEGVRLAAIHTSPLERALETARPLAARHALEPIVNEALVELHMGEWTGRTLDEARRDERFRRFNDLRSLMAPPGGESMLALASRFTAALLELAEGGAGDAGDVVVVSHGDPIRVALLHLLGMPFDHLHRLEIAPASATLVELDRERPPRLLALGIVGSLAEIG